MIIESIRDGIKRIEIKKMVLMIFAGVAFQFMCSGILTFVLKTFFPLSIEGYEGKVDTLTKITLATLLYVCILAPLLEEFVFRGPLFSFIRKYVPFIVANCIQAVFFGIYHMNIIQGIYAFLCGLILGYIVKITGSVVYTIVMHSMSNIAGVVVSNLLPVDISTVITALLWGIGTLVFCVIVYYLNIIEAYNIGFSFEGKRK